MRQVHRTASILAGIFTLLQALIYTVFTIYGCAIYTCMATFPFSIDSKHKTSDLLYLAYFKGKCRISAGEPQVEAASANRTYYFLIAYGIASAVWIPTSTLLVVASVSRVKGHQGALLFYPWIISMIVIIIMDVVGGVWYGLDIVKSLTVKEFLSFLGSNVGPVPENIDGITVAPAMIMVAIFSRGVVIWIINVIFFGVVVQAAREVKKTFSTSEFIRGSTPKGIQKRMEKEAEVAPKPEESEVRWVRVTNDVTLPRLEMAAPAPPPPEQPRQQAPQLPRNDYPVSPQSPIGPDAPSPVIKRRHSLRRTGSSPVFDVMGSPTGETFPFPQDPNRRYVVNNPPRRAYQDPDRFNRDREELEREMSRERALERETERQMALRRELERERQDREFQRMRNPGDSIEGSPREFRRRGTGDPQDEEVLNNQRPWQYVRPTDLNLKPKYAKTIKAKPRFGPEVPPKPAIPPPDYTGSPAPGRSGWDPTNLSRSNSSAAYPDQRWNPRRAY